MIPWMIGVHEIVSGNNISLQFQHIPRNIFFKIKVKITPHSDHESILLNSLILRINCKKRLLFPIKVCELYDMPVTNDIFSVVPDGRTIVTFHYNINMSQFDRQPPNSNEPLGTLHSVCFQFRSKLQLQSLIQVNWRWTSTG